MKYTIPILNLLLLFYSCQKEEKMEKEENPNNQKNSITLSKEQYKNADIETEKLSRRMISSVLKLNGKIDVPPQNLVSISVPVGGYLQSTHLMVGTFVKKGEVLAVMEDAQYIQLQQEYLMAIAQLEFAEKEYQRQKELNQTKSTSDKTLEQAKANYQNQMILMKSLSEKLKLIGVNPKRVSVENISRKINVYSPINGFVSDVNVNIGKYVNPSDVLFELVNPKDIHLNLSVFEKDISKLFIGQKLYAYTNSNPNKKYKGEIILIGKNLTDQNFAEVHCHFEQYDKSLLPGMFMNAEVVVSSKSALSLPTEAIVRHENKQYVFLVKNNNEFEMIEAQLGNTENNYTEILNLENLEDKTFVTNGAYNLLMSFEGESE